MSLAKILIVRHHLAFYSPHILRCWAPHYAPIAPTIACHAHVSIGVA